MRTIICLLVLTLLLAGCGPTDSAIETAIAKTQEAQAFEAAIQTAIAETQEAQTSTSPQPTVQPPQDTLAAEATPPTAEAPPEATPLLAILEPTETAESQEVQPQADVPSLVWSTRADRYAIAGDKITVESGDDQIRAFDVTTGENTWVASASGKLLMADPDIVYIRASEFRVDALDANTGEFRWRHMSQEPVRPVMATDKFVMFSDESKVGGYDLFVIDKSTGDATFSTSIQKVIPPNTWPFEGDSFIARGVHEPRGYGQLLENGRIEWLITDLVLLGLNKPMVRRQGPCPCTSI